MLESGESGKRWTGRSQRAGHVDDGLSANRLELAREDQRKRTAGFASKGDAMSASSCVSSSHAPADASTPAGDAWTASWTSKSIDKMSRRVRGDAEPMPRAISARRPLSRSAPRASRAAVSVASDACIWLAIASRVIRVRAVTATLLIHESPASPARLACMPRTRSQSAAPTGAPSRLRRAASVVSSRFASLSTRAGPSYERQLANTPPECGPERSTPPRPVRERARTPARKVNAPRRKPGAFALPPSRADAHQCRG